MVTTIDDPRPLRLHNAVRRLRDERGWTIDELATRAGISRLTVMAIEGGDHLPRSAVMLRLAQAFGVRLCRVFWSADDASHVA